MELGIIFTNKARCRDCYRCVRECPVKAIRFRDGQASVVQERCIACGTCVRECPQGAKAIRNDLERAKGLLSEAAFVAASIAPSFAAAFPGWLAARIPSALRRLGFRYVAETAIGACAVSAETRRHIESQPDAKVIASSCPAVVSYIEMYEADLTPLLAPVVSPMIAHARHIRALTGADVKVVFIGPCSAKKLEAERREHAGQVDVVLTFEELSRWLEDAGINLVECEESSFDEAASGSAQLYPIEGGLLRTSGFQTDMLDRTCLAVSGFSRLQEALSDVRESSASCVLEPLFCSRGCINGPALKSELNCYSRRAEVLAYAQRKSQAIPRRTAAVELGSAFSARPVAGDVKVSEATIRRVLAATGKSRDEDQLNCGACGYLTCRDKAVAVHLGMAEPEMCIPHMRRMAEQRTDRIIETSPNGIVILDEHLKVLHTNSAFRRMFGCSSGVHGRQVSELFDPAGFERLAANEVAILRGRIDLPQQHLTCHQILYALAEDRQYVGIFVDVTETETQKTELDQLRSKTLQQARELLGHQLNMANTIAQALGENTARAEALIERLTMLARGDKDA